MPPTPAWPRALLRAVAWGALYYVFGQVGLLTTLNDQLLNLVAPAAGIGVVWFATGSRSTWPWDTAVLVGVSVLLALQLEAPQEQVILSTVGVLAQVGLFVFLMRRWAGDLALFGGADELWRARHLYALVGSAVLAGAAVAIGTTLGQAMAGLPAGDVEGLLVRWGRNSSAIVTIGAAGLLLISSRRRAGKPPLTPRRPGEGAAMAAFSAAIYFVAFGVLNSMPLTFLLFTATVWVGTRFSPTTTAMHGLLTGTVAVWFTIEGLGVFASVDNPALQAVLAQLFVLVNSGTGLVIGLVRSELAESERVSEERAILLDDVMRQVSDGILVVDGTGRILVFNPAGRTMLGVQGDPENVASYDIVGPDGVALPEDRRPSVRALAGEVIAGEEIRVRPPGEPGERILRVNAHTLPAVPGELPRALISYHDITLDRLHRDALASFAGHVAHDLKNPLSVIEGWTEALADEFRSGEVDSATGLSMTDRVAGAAERMGDFIRELLDHTLARDQALRPELVDVRALASEVAADRTGEADRDHAPLVELTGAGTAWADPVLVRIVLDNLIGNACKYVAPGVRPEVCVDVAEQGYDWLEVAVSDNGIGIAEDQRHRVFESFHRVEQPGYQGTGLGLAICLRIVERHGGTISVAGAPTGTGSCFRFTLPRRSDVFRRHGGQPSVIG